MNRKIEISSPRKWIVYRLNTIFNFCLILGDDIDCISLFEWDESNICVAPEWVDLHLFGIRVDMNCTKWILYVPNDIRRLWLSVMIIIVITINIQHHHTFMSWTKNRILTIIILSTISPNGAISNTCHSYCPHHTPSSYEYENCCLFWPRPCVRLAAVHL